jgi:putative SOS response-associated peptidase YedK
MCGRYASFLPAEALARLFGAVNPLPNLEPTWNMAPTRDAPVVRLSRDGVRHLDALKWGLIPYFTKDLKKARKPINARSETIAKSGMFKEAFAKRRCLVPAPVYYEWRDDPEGKTPFAVARVDGDPVAFAGIWEAWKYPEGERVQTFATITTDANNLLAGIQDRMPVIIEREDGRSGWANPRETFRHSFGRRRRTPCGSGRSAIGNVRNDGPELLEPATLAEPTLL